MKNTLLMQIHSMDCKQKQCATDAPFVHFQVSDPLKYIHLVSNIANWFAQSIAREQEGMKSMPCHDHIFLSLVAEWAVCLQQTEVCSQVCCWESRWFHKMCLASYLTHDLILTLHNPMQRSMLVCSANTSTRGCIIKWSYHGLLTHVLHMCYITSLHPHAPKGHFSPANLLVVNDWTTDIAFDKIVECL